MMEPRDIEIVRNTYAVFTSATDRRTHKQRKLPSFGNWPIAVIFEMNFKTSQNCYKPRLKKARYEISRLHRTTITQTW